MLWPDFDEAELDRAIAAYQARDPAVWRREEMKQRLLVAAIGVPLLILVLVFLPPLATGILVAAIAARRPTNCYIRPVSGQMSFTA